jgi:phosphatidylcholine synthase
MSSKAFSNWDRVKAWGVHLFTATGVLTVFMAILSTAEGDFRMAMFWLLLAQVIDGLDGTLARKFSVNEVLPNMQGKYIDFVIDFAGYAIVPAYMIYAANIIDGDWNLAMAFLILLTSAIYYGKEGMVSDDHYFVGFPVMWNLVAFVLLFVFDLSHWENILLIVLLAVLQFVPIKVAYPSRTRRWRAATLSCTVIGILSGVLLLYYYPKEVWILDILVRLALGYFILFTVLSTFYFRD